MIGNGASELIDLVTKNAPPGPWKPCLCNIQYAEYFRSAKNAKRLILKHEDPQKAALYTIVNPNNPTGAYLNIDKIKFHIDSLPNDTSVIVDESMQPWHSKNFWQDSLVSQKEWILDMLQKRNICIYIIHSWTKLWTCCGLRIGSLICPTEEILLKYKSLQVPWSVNTLALKYLETVTDPKNIGYLEETWAKTTEWRNYLKSKLKTYKPHWKFYGESFLSYLWIDTTDELEAEKAVKISRAAGFPIRPGSYGYNSPTFIRIAVRSKNVTDRLLHSWTLAAF